MQIGNIYKGRVIDLDYKGDGFIILNDRYVYIENVLPNELIEYEITLVNKRIVKAKVINVLERSNDRVGEPSLLGAINFDHASLDLELKWQRDITLNTFKKVFKKEFDVKETITDNNKYNYRNKSTFHLLKNKPVTFGLYKKNSKKLIRVDDYNLSNINANNLLKIINESNIEVDNNLKHISIKNDYDNNLLVTLVSLDKQFKGLNELIDLIKDSKYVKGITVNIKDNNYEILGNKSYTLYGEDYLTYNKLIMTDKSFNQINFNVMDKTYALIKEHVLGNKIVDLYSGVGSIILEVLTKDKKGLMVENNKENIRLANIIKENKNMTNLEIIEIDAKEVVGSLNGDTFIVDPPQSGLGLEFINEIMKPKPKRLIYLSCNLNTLINDLKTLKNEYIINKVYPIRMFPNTNSFETLVILDLESHNIN